MNKLTRWIQRVFGRTEDLPQLLMAPAYDVGTIAMSKWVKNWSLDNVQLFIGDDAKHERIVTLLNEPYSDTRVFIFVGHGKEAGLLTKPSLGKAHSPISSSNHGCLIDTEDISSNMKGLQVVAWACEAGAYFGPRIATLRNSNYLGFLGSLNLVINHPESEQRVWIPAMKNLFVRILERGHIESHDAEWLRDSLLKIRNDIKNGAINTGIHDRVNSAFLKAAAKGAVVHISKG